jgi:hypothetical protein
MSDADIAVRAEAVVADTQMSPAKRSAPTDDAVENIVAPLLAWDRHLIEEKLVLRRIKRVEPMQDQAGGNGFLGVAKGLHSFDYEVVLKRVRDVHSVFT